jgi:hypothetical protein
MNVENITLIQSSQETEIAFIMNLFEISRIESYIEMEIRLVEESEEWEELLSTYFVEMERQIYI